MKKNPRFPILLLFTAALMYSAMAYNHASAQGRTAVQKDTAFVSFAADAGMLEVYTGKLALANSTTADIKKFGQSMVTDHDKANDELKALAAKKGIKVATALSAKSQKTYEALSKIRGTDFDKAYAEQMVKDHQEVIARFKQEAQSGTDPELKAWAQSKIAKLEHHLMMAQDLPKGSTAIR